MRPWRKLHSTILESERFMDVSLESKVLFFLLVAAQDDSGYYPWERMKIRHLVTSCGWSEAIALKHAESLVAGGMATWEEGGIVLRNGKILNGPSRDDRKPFLYDRHPTDRQRPPVADVARIVPATDRQRPPPADTKMQLTRIETDKSTEKETEKEERRVPDEASGFLPTNNGVDEKGGDRFKMAFLKLYGASQLISPALDRAIAAWCRDYAKKLGHPPPEEWASPLAETIDHKGISGNAWPYIKAVLDQAETTGGLNLMKKGTRVQPKGKESFDKALQEGSW